MIGTTTSRWYVARIVIRQPWRGSLSTVVVGSSYTIVRSPFVAVIVVPTVAVVQVDPVAKWGDEPARPLRRASSCVLRLVVAGEVVRRLGVVRVVDVQRGLTAYSRTAELSVIHAWKMKANWMIAIIRNRNGITTSENSTSA